MPPPPPPPPNCGRPIYPLTKQYIRLKDPRPPPPPPFSDTEALSFLVRQSSNLGPILFLLFVNDLPLTWKNRNGLFADNATFYASASTLTDVQVQLQRDLSNTATWSTKDHGVAAYPQKTKYKIIGTRQQLFRGEECALSLSLDGRQLE